MAASDLTLTRQYTYAEYRDLVIRSAYSNSTTGPDQSSERINATKLNAQRMHRLDKTININPALSALLKQIEKKWKWIVLAESWCGDGAQNIPLIAKMAELNAHIDLKIILRDENPDIMDTHLTSGSRSIPILICIDSTTGKEVGLWGPRPHHISEMTKKFKMENPEISHDDFVKHLHLWYAKDRGESLQRDFIALVPRWKSGLIPY